MKTKFSTVINFINNRFKNFFNWKIDLTNKWKFWSLLMLLVLVFTFVNNYYFYTYVEYSVKKDAAQLKLILNGNLQYFRTHKMSSKKYREHARIITVNFHKKAQYNKSISLHYQNEIKKKTGKLKKGYIPFEYEKDYNKVTQSIINIVIPKLNSDEQLEYCADINDISWFGEEFLLSVFKSMTLSIFDVNHYIQGSRKGFLEKNLEKALKNNLKKDRSEIPFADVLKTVWKQWKTYYWPRSRNPAVFFIVLYLLFYRVRKYQSELYKKIKDLEDMVGENSNEEILEIINCLKIKDEKRLKLLIEDGLDINAKDSEGRTALMLYMLSDEKDKDKKEVIEILLDNGANINERNNVGMTTLMICAQKDKKTSVKILLDNKADTTIKQELTAKDIATPSIKDLISKTQNNHPQELVKILSNFTHKPMKFTTHTWDFGSLESVFGTFDEAMEAVKKQFDSIDKELKVLSFSLHKKITLFLFNVNSTTEDSWCSKADINIGWLSLDGLREHCDNGKNAFDFPLKEKTIVIDNNELNTFGDVINLFKQEIEVRTDFNNLEQIFSNEKKKLGKGFKLNLIDAKLQRQFYTDTQSFSFAIEKIFAEIKKRKEYSNIEVSTREFEDRSLEIKIIQIGSNVDKSAKTLIDEVQSGDFADIKEALTNLCDWSIESACEDGSYRVNYLHSNNIEDVEQLTTEVKGFTHILRFYR